MTVWCVPRNNYRAVCWVDWSRWLCNYRWPSTSL